MRQVQPSACFIQGGIMPAFVFALLLCGLFPLPAGAQPPATELETFLADFSTLQAEFEQTLFDERGLPIETSSGHLAIQRPGKFRWEYRQPYRQTIIADGEKIWIYDEDLAQATVKPYRETLDNTPAVLLTSHHKLADLYQVEAIPDWTPPDQDAPAGVAKRFLLTPIKESAQFQSVTLDFIDGHLMQLTLHDNLDQTTRIHLRQAQRNGRLAAELFVFTPPAGIDIVDGAQ